MSSKQLALPGMERPIPSKPKKPSVQKQIAELEQRVTHLESDLTLLRVQLEGDADHA